MRKKRMFAVPGSIACMLFSMALFVIVIAFCTLTGFELMPDIIVPDVYICIFTMGFLYFSVLLLSRGLTKYVLTDEYLAEKTFWGKTQRKVYLNEIAQTGVSGVQDVHQIPKYIYLSKRILTEDEKRNLLIAGADGSIEFFRYRKKLEKYLKLMTNI